MRQRCVSPGRIVIVERDTSYAECSTGRSLGGLRARLTVSTTPEQVPGAGES